MTDEEVQMIYEYLHENYKYRDGELVSKLTRKGIKKGRSLGYFNYRVFGKPILQGRLKVNDKKYNLDVRKLIYLFHNHIYPEFIISKDGNVTNNKIENLAASDISIDKYEKDARPNNQLGIRGVHYDPINDNFRAVLHINYKCINMRFKTLEEATNAYVYSKNKILFENFTYEKLKEDLIKNGYSNPKKNKLLPGVEKSGSRFMSRPKINGKRTYLGTFNTPEEAHAAYLKAKEDHKNAPNQNI